MAIDASDAARKQILDRIRRAQGRAPAASPADCEAINTYLLAHPRGPLPELSGDLVALFRTRAEASQSTSEIVAGEADLPAAIARLRMTNFRASEALIQFMLDEHSKIREK